MAESITNFLKIKPNNRENVKAEVTVQGVRLEFTLRPLPAERLYDIQIANMVSIPSATAGGPTSEGANPIRLACDILTEAIVEPNLNSIEIQDHFGVTTARDLVQEMFRDSYPALIELMNKAIEASTANPENATRGTSAELVEKAKN